MTARATTADIVVVVTVEAPHARSVTSRIPVRLRGGSHRR